MKLLRNTSQIKKYSQFPFFISLFLCLCFLSFIHMLCVYIRLAADPVFHCTAVWRPDKARAQECTISGSTFHFQSATKEPREQRSPSLSGQSVFYRVGTVVKVRCCTEMFHPIVHLGSHEPVRNERFSTGQVSGLPLSGISHWLTRGQCLLNGSSVYMGSFFLRGATSEHITFKVL